MREIKFRGKRIDNGEWVFGYYFTTKNSNDFENWEEHYIKQFGDDEEFQVVPETLGQSTGLKDRKGKEIYEGDVVVFYEKYQGKIAYRIGGFNFEGENGNTVIQALNTIDCEIIGNIHDNPELLEREEKK